MRFGPPRLENAHDAGPLAVGLDHEHAEHVRLLLGALDVGEDALAVARPRGGEERLHVLVLGEGDEEVEIVRPRAADGDAHSTSSAVFGRRHATTSPDPSATPRRISAEPDHHAGRDRLVEEERAVRDREGRHDVRDERDARVAVERQHVEVDELRDRRAEDGQRGDRERAPPIRAARRAAGRARTAGAAGRR